MDGLARGSSKYFLKPKIIFTLENALFENICVVQATTIAAFSEPKANTSLPTTHYPLPTNNIVMSICKDKQAIYNSVYYALKVFKVTLKHNPTQLSCTAFQPFAMAVHKHRAVMVESNTI